MPGITVKDMWRYIENVVGPEVISRQMPMKEAQESDNDIEKLLEKMVDKKPSLSKVLYFYGIYTIRYIIMSRILYINY